MTPRTDATRSRIIAAGQAVFARYGYRLATMELVAAEVGLARQALYRHFPSKDELFVAASALLHEAAQAAQELAHARALAEQASASEALIAMILARYGYYTGWLIGSPHAPELVEQTHRLTASMVAAQEAAFLARITGLIETARAAGTMPSSDAVAPGELAYMLLAAGAGLKTQLQGDPARFQASYRHMLRVLLAGAATLD